MDQALVAEHVRGMLEPGGAWVHVKATTHQGAPGDDALPAPRPPWEAIRRLVQAYLGTTPRAGQGVLLQPRSGEEDVMRAAGYRGPQRVYVEQGQVVRRGVDEVVSAVFSLSGSAPHRSARGWPRSGTTCRPSCSRRRRTASSQSGRRTSTW